MHDARKPAFILKQAPNRPKAEAWGREKLKRKRNFQFDGRHVRSPPSIPGKGHN